MTTKINTVRYKNAPLSVYKKEKYVKISEGWAVLEENIQRKEIYLNTVFKGIVITGSIVYERK
jgi:hypothetical protein